MYAIDIAQTGSSEALWAWFAAGREVDEALSELDAAGAALVPLVAETDWHADGVRALHTLLEDLRRQTESERGRLSARQWELERMTGA
ncbi:hypothetical protein [Microbacterium sp.]|uniref:hypothetical protein n=1 Tax=Microbacterium sp. TaxID=51671 RepID=UPI0028118557|nr:hypothetical protein [Microbacterium sp.]